MDVEIREEPKLIAKRVPPGDNWKIEGAEEVIEGLLRTISAYQKWSGYKGAYKFDPLGGKLYKYEKIEIEPEQPDYFDIYGES